MVDRSGTVRWLKAARWRPKRRLSLDGNVNSLQEGRGGEKTTNSGLGLAERREEVVLMNPRS